MKKYTKNISYNKGDIVVYDNLTYLFSNYVDSTYAIVLLLEDPNIDLFDNIGALKDYKVPIVGLSKYER